MRALSPENMSGECLPAMSVVKSTLSWFGRGPDSPAAAPGGSTTPPDGATMDTRCGYGEVVKAAEDATAAGE
jgi:hypothetical protein